MCQVNEQYSNSERKSVYSSSIDLKDLSSWILVPTNIWEADVPLWLYHLLLPSFTWIWSDYSLLFLQYKYISVNSQETTCLTALTSENWDVHYLDFSKAKIRNTWIKLKYKWTWDINHIHYLKKYIYII